MATLGGLNLGGADKNPATPPSGPATDKKPEAESNTAGATTGQNEQGTVNQVIESIAKNETDTQANLNGTREQDLEPGKKLEPKDESVDVPPAEPADVKIEPTDKQKDADGVAEQPKTDGEIADAVADLDSTLRDDVAARWSSAPIQRYTVGDYHFENGLLVLRTQEEADAFQKMYDELPIYEQTRIQKVDVRAAEALVRARLAAGGTATKSIDSSTGDRAPQKQVGKGDLLAGSGE